MFARFAGIGVGHSAVNLGQVPALSITEDNEVDVEAYRESKESNIPDEVREHSGAGYSLDDDDDDDTEEDLDLGNVSSDSEVDEDNSYY